ncbi:MAG: hypothetical protein HRU19_26805 [Pseudobacteriovorax sp.]|nr:hypothetical protein [Pseudobacteriovorax sp.]
MKVLSYSLPVIFVMALGFVLSDKISLAIQGDSSKSLDVLEKHLEPSLKKGRKKSAVADVSQVHQKQTKQESSMKTVSVHYSMKELGSFAIGGSDNQLGVAANSYQGPITLSSSRDRKFVLDQANQMVKELKAGGRLEKAVHLGSSQILDMAVGENIYLLDGHGKNQIHIYDQESESMSTISLSTPQNDTPEKIYVDAEQNLHVAVGQEYYLVDEAGQLTKVPGIPLSHPNQYAALTKVSEGHYNIELSDADGNLYSALNLKRPYSSIVNSVTDSDQNLYLHFIDQIELVNEFGQLELFSQHIFEVFDARGLMINSYSIDPRNVYEHDRNYQIDAQGNLIFFQSLEHSIEIKQVNLLSYNGVKDEGAAE